MVKKRKGLLVFALVTTVVIAGVFVAVRLSTSKTPSPARTSSSSNINITATVLIDEFFPATSAEYNSHPPQPWRNFVFKAMNRWNYSCMIGFGFPSKLLQPLLISPPPVSDPPQDGFYPNVAQLETGNLNLVPIKASSPGSSIPASEQAAFDTDIRKCNNRTFPQFPADKLLGPILQPWYTGISSVQNVPSVQSATARWSSCVASYGVPAASVDEWLSNLDQVIRSAPSKYNSNRYLAPAVIARVKIFGRCIVPLANAMDQVRLKLRSTILDRFGSELVNISQMMTAEIATYDNRYGLAAS